jgi:RNA polymerase sigma-70 factor (family 1)
MTNKDNELIEGICRKDKQCFELLYKGHYKKLYVLAFQYVRQQEMAEEIVNDVFLKVWNDAEQLNIKQSLGPYLSRCVINMALNSIKKESRKAANELRFLSGYEEYEEENDAAQILENKLIRLEKALDSLPPQCRKVIMMSKFDKCKQQEIADALNISVKTVKSHLTNGYEKIRVMLSKEQVLFFFLLSAVELRLLHLINVL